MSMTQVQLDQTRLAQLDDIAVAQSTSREAIINEALDSYLNDVSLLHAEVKAGRDSLTNGKAVPNEEVERYFSAKRADLKRMVVRK